MPPLHKSPHDNDYDPKEAERLFAERVPDGDRHVWHPESEMNTGCMTCNLSTGLPYCSWADKFIPPGGSITVEWNSRRIDPKHGGSNRHTKILWCPKWVPFDASTHKVISDDGAEKLSIAIIKECQEALQEAYEEVKGKYMTLTAAIITEHPETVKRVTDEEGKINYEQLYAAVQLSETEATKMHTLLRRLDAWDDYFTDSCGEDWCGVRRMTSKVTGFKEDRNFKSFRKLCSREAVRWQKHRNELARIEREKIAHANVSIEVASSEVKQLEQKKPYFGKDLAVRELKHRVRRAKTNRNEAAYALKELEERNMFLNDKKEDDESDDS